ncbi:MAG: DUF389 domain-containing protein [Bacteroidota bacterium]|jgi:uncharacterized hydrophobic protein (TIGR00271 family)|nr:DUF389 domain-containing protein [Bacteroidota bacterium]HHU96759.1 DUF389 domain-containing protein [Petrimonas sp.]
MKFLHYFDLRQEMESFDSIHAEIEKGIEFKGTNLWILMCAILVASVGLNMNSTAVIIGAMLISPLMGPINGMGYGIATYDMPLFRRAVKNFTFAVGVSLITSALYFFITPVSTAHSELLARTSPTIYDVLIAFFGGLAGILAISSKLKGNVIPGVAIATALMPPICTAGYGLATLQFNFVFGALYLFTINTVFIAVAALLVCQVLKFPIRSVVDPQKRKGVNRIISAVLLITTVPSIILGYNLVQQENFNEAANRYIQNISVLKNAYLLESNVDVNHRSIDLVYSGYGLSDEDMAKVKETALVFQLDTTKIGVISGADAEILRQSTSRYRTEAQELENKLNATTAGLQVAKSQLDSVLNIPTKGEYLLKEIRELYPQITACSYSETILYEDTTKSELLPMVIFKSSRAINRTDRNKISSWIETRLQNENAKTYFE